MYYISEKWETFFERISPQSMCKIKVNNEVSKKLHFIFLTLKKLFHINKFLVKCQPEI